MKANRAQILWTRPNSTMHPARAGQVVIRELGQAGAEWDAHDFKGGACYTDVKQLKGVASVARLFIDFNTMVVRDGIDPQVAHKAFLAIDEYRKALAPDIPGAE